MELEIKDYFKIVARRWWLILVMGAIFCAPVALYEQYMTQPSYEANTKLIVTNASRGANQTILDTNEINSNIMIINTYKEIIKSPAIMDKVKQEHPEIVRSTQQLIDDIGIAASDKSQVMNISLRDSSQDQAAIVVNAVAEVFRREIPRIMSVDNVTILSAAKQLDHPVPVPSNLLLKLILMAFVSFVCSIGIIFLREYLDDTIKTEEDVRAYLGQPTLAMVAKARIPEWRGRADAIKGKVGIESIQQG